MAQQFVSCLENGILTLCMNKPKVNSFSIHFQNQLAANLKHASNDPKVRGILIKSNFPTCFSAGLDLAEVGELVKEKNKQKIAEYGSHQLYKAFHSPILCPKPVACAVNGHAIAGGLVLALACDYFSLGTGEAKTEITKIDRKSADRVEEIFRVKGIKLGLTEHQVGVPFPDHVLRIADRQLSPSTARNICNDGLLMNEHEAYNMGIADVISTDAELHALKWLQHMITLPGGAFALTKSKWWNHPSPDAPNLDYSWADQLLSHESSSSILSYLSRIK